MNVLARSITRIARTCVGNSISGTTSSLMRIPQNTGIQGSILNTFRLGFCNLLQGLGQVRQGSTLRQMHKRSGPYFIPKKKNNPLEGKPFARGTITKVIIRKPKKPNSANRKCVIIKLSSGKEVTAFIPKVGHNLQEHQMVLVRPGRVQDTPGVNVRCIRGKYDLAHPSKPK